MSNTRDEQKTDGWVTLVIAAFGGLCMALSLVSGSWLAAVASGAFAGGLLIEGGVALGWFPRRPWLRWLRIALFVVCGLVAAWILLDIVGSWL